MAIQGLFTGEISYVDQKRPAVTVEFETGPTEVEAGRLKGSYSVRTFKDGERAGNSSSNGTLDGIMNTSGQSSALVVSFGPEQFAQLYIVPGGEALVGNVYEMTTAKDSILIGRVRLTR